jgi:CotS family spore coat protein
MFSKVPPWMKEILKEFTKPPSIIQHNGQPANSSKPSQNRYEQIGDNPSSPTDPTPKSQTRTRKRSSSSSGNRSARSGSSKNKMLAEASLNIHPEYDLRVLQAYPFEVEHFEPFQHIVKLETTKHNWMALKLTAITPEKIWFLHRAHQYMKKNGFSWFSPIIPTSSGKPYVQNGRLLYYITRWIDGPYADFGSLTQLGKTAESLARFHEASIGFETTGRHPRMAFDLYRLYADRSQQMQTILRSLQAKSNPSKAEQLLIQHTPTFLKQATTALTLFKDRNVIQHLDREEDMPGLCHLDLVERNCIHHASKHVYLIDFDNMTYAPRVLDLAHLIRRGMQKTNWSPQVALVALINYNGIRPLNHAEYVMLEGLLTYPHRWWRLLQLAPSTSQHSELLTLLQTFMEQEESRQQFLRSFSRQVTRHKTVS